MRGGKWAYRYARLLRPATKQELLDRGVFLDGTHTVHGTKFAALGRTRVRAYGDSHGSAYEKASVVAKHNACVRMMGDTRFIADGSSRITAEHNASGVVREGASVDLYGNGTIEAFDEVIVHVNLISTCPTVILHDRAVCIDARGAGDKRFDAPGTYKFEKWK